MILTKKKCKELKTRLRSCVLYWSHSYAYGHRLLSYLVSHLNFSFSCLFFAIFFSSSFFLSSFGSIGTLAWRDYCGGFRQGKIQSTSRSVNALSLNHQKHISFRSALRKAWEGEGERQRRSLRQRETRMNTQTKRDIILYINFVWHNRLWISSKNKTVHNMTQHVELSEVNKIAQLAKQCGRAQLSDRRKYDIESNFYFSSVLVVCVFFLRFCYYSSRACVTRSRSISISLVAGALVPLRSYIFVDNDNEENKNSGKNAISLFSFVCIFIRCVHSKIYVRSNRVRH